MASYNRIVFAFVLLFLFSCSGINREFGKAVNKDKHLVDLLLSLEQLQLYTIYNSPYQDSLLSLSNSQLTTLQKAIPKLQGNQIVIPVIEITANTLAANSPADAILFIAKQRDHIQSLYETYTTIYQDWIINEPKQAKLFLLENSQNWANEKKNIRKDLCKIFVEQELISGSSDSLREIINITPSFLIEDCMNAYLQLFANSPKLFELGALLHDLSDTTISREIYHNYVISSAQAAPPVAMHWLSQIPEATIKKSTANELFYYLGNEYAIIGAQWFNSAPNRAWIRNSDIAELELICINAYIKGLTENYGTSLHPKEVVNMINDVYYRPMLDTALNKPLAIKQ